MVHTPGLTLAREIARVHAARLVQGFWGKPITQTILRAARWDGSARALRDTLAHYRDEFARESDRYKVGNAHLGRIEIWAGSRWWPQASDAWRWGYQWTHNSSGQLVGTATIETNPDARTSEMYWWIIAALLDYRPILDTTNPGKLTEWARPRFWSRSLTSTRAEASEASPWTGYEPPSRRSSRM